MDEQEPYEQPDYETFEQNQLDLDRDMGEFDEPDGPEDEWLDGSYELE